jgi:hypothetical protein
MKAGGVLAGLTLAASFFGCGGAKPSPSNSPSSPSGTGDVAPGTPAVSIVASSYVLSSCPESQSMNARAAETAMRKLIEPCEGIAGDAAHFSATLEPGGRIVLASPLGDPKEGTVPTCVLMNRLIHGVALRQPCRFDVRLEQRPAGRKSG